MKKFIIKESFILYSTPVFVSSTYTKNMVLVYSYWLAEVDLYGSAWNLSYDISLTTQCFSFNKSRSPKTDSTTLDDKRLTLLQQRFFLLTSLLFRLFCYFVLAAAPYSYKMSLPTVELFHIFYIMQLMQLAQLKTILHFTHILLQLLQFWYRIVIIIFIFLQIRSF